MLLTFCATRPAPVGSRLLSSPPALRGNRCWEEGTARTVLPQDVPKIVLGLENWTCQPSLCAARGRHEALPRSVKGCASRLCIHPRALKGCASRLSIPGLFFKGKPRLNTGRDGNRTLQGSGAREPRAGWKRSNSTSSAGKQLPGGGSGRDLLEARSRTKRIYSRDSVPLVASSTGCPPLVASSTGRVLYRLP